MLNLELPGTLKLLSEQIKNDINLHCVAKYNDGHRSHLGASLIGKGCSRALWYSFRWVYNQVHDGRMYRLFQRGHFEESRFTSYLEGIGCEVTIFDESHLDEIDKGKRQIRISDCKGHFGGSIDAKIKLPTRYGIEQDVLFLGEYKTQGTQKFAKLQLSGVKLEKYQHFCQQSVYGFKLGLKYAIYMAVDKNTDELHIEVIELDWFLGQELINKAERIIFAQEPPNKISASASFFECKWCDFNQVCWNNKPAEINCRSCKRSVAVDNAEWYCKQYDLILPKENIKNGCATWESLI